MPRRPQRRRLLQPIVQFIQAEASSGILLMAAAVIALIWANSPWAVSYTQLWQAKLTVAIGTFEISKAAILWINDGLMAVFFLLVGLEIKRELLLGQLSSFRQAALPVAAAIGGMVVPALLFLVFNPSGPAARGWGIPMATDIAFALGILALLGPRIPVGLKVFLAALAIVDDLGAVLVIALFYTSEINVAALLGAVGVFAILLIFNRLGVRKPTPYALAGLALWVLFLKSGVHATIAGVLLAMTIPTRVFLNARDYAEQVRTVIDEFEASGEFGEHVLMSEARTTAIEEIERASEEAQMPLERLEHSLHPWVSYFIMPIFALANAGIPLGAGVEQAMGSPIAWGVFAGLVIGKPIGIFAMSWIAVKTNLAALPKGVGWRHIAGVGMLGGVGFTMALFIAELALTTPEKLVVAKMGIMAASLVAGVIGFLLLKKAGRVRRTPKPA